MTLTTRNMMPGAIVRINGGRHIIVGRATLRGKRVYLPVRRSYAGSAMYGRTQYVRATHCTAYDNGATPSGAALAATLRGYRLFTPRVNVARRTPGASIGHQFAAVGAPTAIGVADSQLGVY